MQEVYLNDKTYWVEGKDVYFNLHGRTLKVNNENTIKDVMSQYNKFIRKKI